ncbi:MAG: hypothetical protein QXI16_03920 [Sulfolobaceae archaeon]
MLSKSLTGKLLISIVLIVLIVCIGIFAVKQEQQASYAYVNGDTSIMQYQRVLEPYGYEMAAFDNIPNDGVYGYSFVFHMNSLNTVIKRISIQDSDFYILGSIIFDYNHLIDRIVISFSNLDDTIIYYSTFPFKIEVIICGVFTNCRAFIKINDEYLGRYNIAPIESYYSISLSLDGTSTAHWSNFANPLHADFGLFISSVPAHAVTVLERDFVIRESSDYLNGYNAGQSDSMKSWDNLLPSIFGSTASFFLILLGGIELFGTSLLTLIATVGCFILIFTLITKIRG